MHCKDPRAGFIPHEQEYFVFGTSSGIIFSSDTVDANGLNVITDKQKVAIISLHFTMYTKSFWSGLVGGGRG